MKKTLLALAIAGAAISAQADVSVSGHVNYAMGSTKDFNGNNDFSVANNGASGSRFRIVASKEANGITYGTRQELGLDSGSGPTFGRVSQVTIGGDFGQFSLGQGWESGDDATEKDFSGTYLTSGGGHSGFGGSKVSNIDGGRDQRLRYDSPKIGGVLNIAADIDTNDNLGLAFAAGGSNWKAGLFIEDNDASNTDEIGGSVAFKVAGFTAALQLSQKELGASNSDGDYKAVILGYNIGKISVAIDFANREDQTGSATTLDRSTTGLNFNYRPTGGVELYAGIRTAKDDIAGATTYNGNDDGDAVILGARVKF